MMKKYRNTKTGVVIATPCDISGENWEPVKTTRRQKADPAEEKQEAPEEAPEPEKAPEQEAAEEPDGVEIGPKAENNNG